ncbi:hypothetical protein FKM82_025399 [Ascaphus truei]
MLTYPFFEFSCGFTLIRLNVWAFDEIIAQSPCCKWCNASYCICGLFAHTLRWDSWMLPHCAHDRHRNVPFTSVLRSQVVEGLLEPRSVLTTESLMLEAFAPWDMRFCFF